MGILAVARERRERLSEWLSVQMGSWSFSTRRVAFHFEGGAWSRDTILRDLRALEREGVVERELRLGLIYWRLASASPKEAR